MPEAPTIFGGADCLSHIIENLVGTGANDYTEIILLECLKRVWTWLPVAVENPNNIEAREQLSWAAHNSLANGGIPNGHAVGHAIGSLYHLVHGHACIIVLPTVIRHFSETAQGVIQKIAKVIGISITGNEQEDSNNVANAILDFYKKLGLKPFKETIEEKGINDNEETFIEKIIPAILDDFKSKQWLPPIHLENSTEKIAEICKRIYQER